VYQAKRFSSRFFYWRAFENQTSLKGTVTMARIESLLTARLFLVPQLVGERLFFLSNLSGQLSLYGMNYGGSVPEPLIPPHIALQNPHLIDGHSFYVFPNINKILVMIDKDGDENYQPMLIPMEGGFPEPAFEHYFSNYRVHLGGCDPENNKIYLMAESQDEQLITAFQGDLETGELVSIGSSKWGSYPAGHSSDHRMALLIESYTVGDHVLYLWRKDREQNQLLYGVPLEERQEGQEIPINGIIDGRFTPDEMGLMIVSAIFTDSYDLGFMDLNNPENVKPITITGLKHTGSGEMTSLKRIKDNRYLVEYNIDGSSWLYEGSFDSNQLRFQCDYVICGRGQLSNGVLESVNYDLAQDRYAISFSTATSPTQIYTIEGKDRQKVVMHTAERILGIPQAWLSPGEDASYTSFDGIRVSARLYLPSPALNYEGARPLVYYVHGGPQGQERPDFAWFSMPLIQFLTIKGFAVFVPNVRGSTGYGLSYTKHVDRDWGGKDRLDHVHAMEILAGDPRIDTTRAGVTGRSYGGYMTLMLASRHPELWSAAVDMFGPYDLFTFMERIPETWKPYFLISVGDPQKDADFLTDRSPRTHMERITCPLLVIQGKNDPRVVEQESHDLVEYLRSLGKEVEYLMFPNEGHDVLKFENRVTCYNAITEFFEKYLNP
jgi:pimeloyl-ACP methyl ester carboxylesterase